MVSGLCRKVWGDPTERQASDEVRWRECTYHRFVELLRARGGMKGVGVDGWSLKLAQQLGDKEMAMYYRWVMGCIRKAEVSDTYGRWIALLIDKKGEDRRNLGRKRDLWLMCHGLKVITMVIKKKL